MIFGSVVAIKFHHRILRDHFKLVLFGWNSGDPDRDALADQDGLLFIWLVIVGLTTWGGLKAYNVALIAVAGENDDSEHITDEGMHGLTFASYNLIVSGIFTFLADSYTIVAVADQIAQSLVLSTGVGYLAYGNNTRLRNFCKWWCSKRLFLTRFLLLLLWPFPTWCLVENYQRIKRQLSTSSLLEFETIDPFPYGFTIWNRETNTEVVRMVT